MDLNNPNLLIVRTSEQLCCELDGEIAILNLSSKLYFGLTDVGATVWRTLETPQSYESIVSIVLAQYDVDADRCRRDVHTFLRDLDERGLLQFAQAA